ncbi:glycosyltransferase [Roseovarius aquimarinus]|uniref:Glycosyltransferase n=1 Tax=Roseovarius aquimarinus TaxID=1229156 RepID=A0ABW7IBC0_9RHOB
MTRRAPHAGPLVSVIVPIHNVATHVGKCIESLRAQILADFEAILIDDGSTDDSAARAAEAICGDCRFRLVRQANAGLSAARNAGLDLARGAFIAFLDSDDRLAPDFLSRLWRSLDETGADWAACGIQFSLPDGTGGRHSAIHGAPDMAWHGARRLYRFRDWCDVIPHFPSVWNKLYRRSLIDGLRFDEGTWFEDHAFFHAAAARTDHLLHLPEPLYIQTRDRSGQITSLDDDRVFEQLGVLDRLRGIFERSNRPGAQRALSRIATRLVFERSTILANPERRADFAAAAQRHFQTNGLTFEPNWDDDIAQSWRVEMEGDLPLTIVIAWNGEDTEALSNTARSLLQQTSPGHEVRLVCETFAAQRKAKAALPDLPSNWTITHSELPDEGAAFNHGLAHARGAFVVFLLAGDTLPPGNLLLRTEAMLRSEADFGFAPMRLVRQDDPQAIWHNGIHDMAPCPMGTPVAGEVSLTPAQALSLEAHASAKIFRRSFIEAHGIRFSEGPRSDWAPCLAAALLAERCIYLAEAGAEIPLIGDGFARWHRPEAPGMLRRSHAILVATLKATLPTHTRAALPSGWERRLFARALRERAYFGTSHSRRARMMLATHAALASARLGYGQDRAAGLDPQIGPKLAKVLRPRALIAEAIARAPVAAPQSARRLHALDGGQGALIDCRADLSGGAHANITFAARSDGPALLHISIRPQEGVVVFNDQRSDLTWRREHRCAATFEQITTRLSIRFDDRQLCVSLDEREIFGSTKGPLPRRRRFAGLHEATGFEIGGGVHVSTVLCPLETGGGISLDARLDLRVPEHFGATHLCDAHGTALEIDPAPGRNGGRAMLPGRLWQHVGEEDPLVISAKGMAHEPPFCITRAEIAARIDALLRLPLAVEDSALCLTILEHMRNADLRPRLSEEAGRRADEIARHFGLSEFLAAAPSIRLAPSRPPPVPQNRLRAEIDSAVARLAQSQIAPKGQRPDPLAIVADTEISAAATIPYFLQLTEFFCLSGNDFDGLHEIAATRCLLPLAPPPGRWALSASLPFSMMAKRYTDVSDALHAMAGPSDEWIVTPAIGWTLQRAFEDRTLPEDSLGWITAAFLEFLTAQASGYWDRAHCRELTLAAAQIVKRRRRLPRPLRDETMHRLGRIYALSPVFWSALEGETLPREMTKLRGAFAAMSSGETTNKALATFDAADAIDAPRLRRELSDPSRAPTGDVLRHMAFPGSCDLPDRAADTLPERLAELYPETPRAPQLAAQHIAADLARRSLDEQRLIPGLLGALAPLCDAASHHLGIGIALSVIAGFRDTNAADVATLATWSASRMDKAGDTACRAATALEGPARRLLRMSAPPAALRHLLDQLDRLDVAPSGSDAGGLPDGAPLFDTLVVVFSCRPYLETRIPALRSGWLSLLEPLGIPFIVVVGGGDGTLEGDILHLDAPDDYEGLPQKTLAAIDWVHRNTRFGHMLKIDDDCFLNAPLFFGALTYRKFDYHGRRLHRVPGQLDRVWHQAKSTSERGRMDLDKSPEPSEYADGGSGYTLSRRGMRAALDAAASAEGRRLIAAAFMEDKMLGDLLAMRDIRVSQEEYRVSIRRRAHPKAIPVASWLNSFFPSRSAPVHLVHLDTHLDQRDALKRLSAPGLWPRKIWPSYQNARLGYQSNALELVSGEASVRAARDAPVAVVACMRNEMFMLPHFLAHYRRLGVEAFLIADNSSVDGTLEYLADQPDVALFSVDTDYRLSHYGVAWQQAMLAAFRVGKWSLIADADELLVWQENRDQTLQDLLAGAAFKNADAARVFMLDMYPGGPLEKADFASGDPFAEAGYADAEPFLRNTLGRGPFSDQPCWTSALRHRLIPASPQNLFVAQKLALLKYQPWMRLSAGLHFVGGTRVAERELIFGHFKYNSDFRRKAQAEVARGQHFNDAEEYRKYLALASEGRSVIYDADLSMRWSDVPFVRRRLGS